MQTCWLHSTAKWREFVSFLRAGWCLWPPVRLSRDSFFSWTASIGKSTTFCLKWLRPVLFCRPPLLWCPSPLCFPAAVSRWQNCSELPPQEALLYTCPICPRPAGSEHRLNQHLKNSESWAAASLMEGWLREKLKGVSEQNWLWSVSRLRQLCFVTKALRYKQVAESL